MFKKEFENIHDKVFDVANSNRISRPNSQMNTSRFKQYSLLEPVTASLKNKKNKIKGMGEIQSVIDRFNQQKREKNHFSKFLKK